MKRSAFRSRAKPRRPAPLVAKRLSLSAIHKGPMRSKSHLALVREQPCLICGTIGVHAHHARVGLRTMGVRKSDESAVPLCPPCHADLHSGLEEAFWEKHGVDPLAWCREFVKLHYRAPSGRSTPRGLWKGGRV